MATLIGAIDLPRTFVEFGFHPYEFNCIGLLRSHRGLLLDADIETTDLARAVLPSNILVRQAYLTLENLNIIVDHFGRESLGILSIDVDGNDFWFLRSLLAVRPGLVAVEYNATFGLRPVTVPYDATFNRHQKHNSGWYHGASLVALDRLCSAQGYDLVAVAAGGANGFFVRADLRPQSLRRISVEEAYKENAVRNRLSQIHAAQQWENIKHLPYVEIDPGGSS